MTRIKEFQQKKKRNKIKEMYKKSKFFIKIMPKNIQRRSRESEDYSRKVYEAMLDLSNIIISNLKDEDVKSTIISGKEMLGELLRGIAEEFLNFPDNFFENENCKEPRLCMTPKGYVELSKRGRYEDAVNFINATKNIVLKEELKEIKELRKKVKESNADLGGELGDFITKTEKNIFIIEQLALDAKTNPDYLEKIEWKPHEYIKAAKQDEFQDLKRD